MARRSLKSRISHVIGFDDAPFDRTQSGDVLLVGTVFSRLRLEGVVSGKVRKDGVNSTKTIARLASKSRFADHLQGVFLQGIAVAGFNVIDIQALNAVLRIPVVVVARKQPDFTAIRDALLTRVRGGERKWQLIERLGPMQAVAGVYVQCAGINLAETERLIEDYAVNGVLPEPLRTAHIIAGGIALGESRHRA